MKINMAAGSLSPTNAQQVVGNLVKEFCQDYKISFNADSYTHLISDGVEHLARWSKEEKGLPFTYTKIADDLKTFGIVFDFEENGRLVEVLLKTEGQRQA